MNVPEAGVAYGIRGPYFGLFGISCFRYTDCMSFLSIITVQALKSFKTNIIHSENLAIAGILVYL